MSDQRFIPADLLYEAIVASSDDAIISKNLTGIVMSWNPAAHRIFGYRGEEMIGQSIMKLLPSDRLNEESEILARLKRGERIEHFETKRQRKDGRIIDVSLTISPICDSGGVIVGASKIARDIAAQKEAERKSAEAVQELKRINQIKSEFLTTLSHELRTPLNAILGWVQLLQEGLSPDEVSKAAETIARNVNAQSQMIEDLLDMGRIESGKMSLDLQNVDLGAVISASVETVRPTAEAKKIRLTSAFSSLNGVVMADKSRLQQIIWNLLTNAIKFTPSHGRIHVVVRRVNSHVEISVTDTGQGIPPEFLGLVFDRFQQVDSTAARHHGGLGLGLSIAKQLTELHGGTIRVASEGPGQGATFTVDLPLQSVVRMPDAAGDDGGNAAADEEAIKADLTGVKVLVVDDEEDGLQSVRIILERNGAQVCLARSMEEALLEFERFAPHVLVSDIGLPRHDGFELIRRLRALPGGPDIPAVALTALARPKDRTRALRAGFQVHVAKPVDFTELVAVVQNLASISRRRD